MNRIKIILLVVFVLYQFQNLYASEYKKSDIRITYEKEIDLLDIYNNLDKEQCQIKYSFLIKEKKCIYIFPDKKDCYDYMFSIIGNDVTEEMKNGKLNTGYESLCDCYLSKEMIEENPKLHSLIKENVIDKILVRVNLIKIIITYENPDNKKLMQKDYPLNLKKTMRISNKKRNRDKK